MYKLFKKLIFGLFPKQWLLSNQFIFRRINHFLFYSGNKVHCNICNQNSRVFIDVNNNAEKLCPCCGSISRTRSVWFWLNNQKMLNPNIKVLHFSPHRYLQKKLQKVYKKNYISTDIEGHYTNKNHDITQINEPDNTFDLIICLHVLEHVVNDQMAMAELYRVLAPTGKIIFQVPFKEGEIYEDFTITKPEDRLIAFGQEDHVRHYSLSSFITRLEKAGFLTQLFIPANFEELNSNLHQIKTTETFVIARKS